MPSLLYATILATTIATSISVESYRSVDAPESFLISSTDSIDQQDLLMLFGELGITRARFTLQQESSAYGLYPVIDEYREGELVSSKSIVDSLMSQIPGFTSDKAGLVLQSVLKHLVVSDASRELRLYVRQHLPDRANLTMSIELQPMRFTFPVDTSTTGGGGARAFSYSGITLGERTPLLSLYYVPKGEGFIDCPADADVATIASTYHHVIVIYAEARPLN